MATQELKAGPVEPSFLTLVLKTFAGAGGGIVGTLILLVIFLLGASILQPTFTGTAESGVHPLFIFVFMAMIFLTSLGSNLVGPLLFGYVQQDKYGRPATAMTQIFIANLVVFGLMAPVYLIVFSFGLDLTAILAGIHVMITALASTLVLEIIGNLRYALLGVYSMILSILFATGVIFIFYQFTERNLVILLFVTLPVLWTFIGFISTIVEMFYSWIYRLYGKDFLASTTSFGREYGEEEEEPEEKPDVSGSEFLGK